jgi:hypothetical protein
MPDSSIRPSIADRHLHSLTPLRFLRLLHRLTPAACLSPFHRHLLNKIGRSCHAPIFAFSSIRRWWALLHRLLCFTMLYLVNEATSPNFLYSVLCSIFHFSSIDNDLSIHLDPPPMDPEPPDRHPTPVMSLPPPDLPHPPQTNTSNPSTESA